MTDFAKHREQVLAVVKAQERSLRAGQDWWPVLFVDRPEGATVMEMPEGLRTLPAGPMFLAQQLRNHIDQRPLYVHWATVQPAYLSAPGGGDEREVVLVLLGSTSQPEDLELWSAKVFRPRGQHPVLGAWESVGEPDGPMVAPYYEAMTGRPWAEEVTVRKGPHGNRSVHPAVTEALRDSQGDGA